MNENDDAIKAIEQAFGEIEATSTPLADRLTPRDSTDVVVNETKDVSKQYAWCVLVITPPFEARYPRDSFSYRVYIEPQEWYRIVREWNDGDLEASVSLEAITELYKTGLVPRGKAPDIMEPNSRLSFIKVTGKGSSIALEAVVMPNGNLYKVSMTGRTESVPRTLPTPERKDKVKEFGCNIFVDYTTNEVVPLALPIERRDGWLGAEEGDTKLIEADAVEATDEEIERFERNEEAPDGN